MHQIIFTQLILLFFLNKTLVQAIKHVMHKINTILLCRHLRCHSCTPLQSIESIRIAVPTVLGELRCDHITSVYFGMGRRELFWKCVRQLCRVLRWMRSPVAVLKLGSCADQPLVLLGTRKTGFRNICFQMNPCIKYCFPQIKP